MDGCSTSDCSLIRNRNRFAGLISERFLNPPFKSNGTSRAKITLKLIRLSLGSAINVAGIGNWRILDY